jgi:iron(II)-dependent oxidoreductase
LIFPWGNTFDGTKLNYCDSNCEFNWRDAAYSDLNPYPAPVGAYPAGTSWVGALDMAGSLWEWTSTIYSAYPYDPSDGRENLNDRSSARTLRGGAWNWIALDARTTGRDNPVQPSSDWYGFRCARDYVEGDLP